MRPAFASNMGAAKTAIMVPILKKDRHREDRTILYECAGHANMCRVCEEVA